MQHETPYMYIVTYVGAYECRWNVIKNAYAYKNITSVTDDYLLIFWAVTLIVKP